MGNTSHGKSYREDNIITVHGLNKQRGFVLEALGVIRVQVRGIQGSGGGREGGTTAGITCDPERPLKREKRQGQGFGKSELAEGEEEGGERRCITRNGETGEN